MLLIPTTLHLFIVILLFFGDYCSVTQAQAVPQSPRITSLPTKTQSLPTTTDPGLIGLPTFPSEPEVVVYPASCQSEGTWYIQGGFHNVSFHQLFSLDLTTPWNITYAPWKEYLSTPPMSTQNCIFVSKGDLLQFQDINNPYTTRVSSSVSLTGNPTGPDGSDLVLFGNEDRVQPFMSVLNMTTGAWHYNASSMSLPVRNPGIISVVNPLDGRIYLRGGHQSDRADTMDIYDPKRDTITSLPIPIASAINQSIISGGTRVERSQWYAACWSFRRSSILYLGGRMGYSAEYASPEIIEYKPDSNTWAKVPVTGTGPSIREDGCMVTDKANNRVVVFGGQNTNGSLSDIYILDMKTLEWTRGENAGSGRLGMACSMYNDGFLVWGGTTDTFLIDYPSSNPMVFNLTTMRWTSRYRQTDPLNPDPVPIINRGPNLGLILGLSISLFGVIAIAGGVYLFRREKRKAARDYGKINNGKGINIDHNSPIGPSSHSRAGHPDGLDPIDSDISFGTLPASSAPLSYQNGRQKRLLTVSRSLNQNSGEYYSAKEGSGVDSASIRTATSGKYVHDSEEETASRKTRRRYQRPNYLLGHKIEMSSMGPQGNGAGDIVTSLNSNGDPTNISPACPHAIAPYAAPSAPPNPNIKKT